jgi:predicted dehydrogenase
MKQSSRVNFGIIGTGNIAQGGHGKAFQDTTSAQLLSVYSRDLGRAQMYAAQYGASGAFSSLEEMLDDTRLNAVIITSPDKLHFEHACTVAQAKKHILLEKPMVTDSSQGEELIKVCKDNGVLVAVAYHLRHHEGHRQLVSAVHSGAIGRPVHVRVHWSWRSENASNWRASSELGRWWSLAGVGTHCLDLVRWVLLPSAGEVDVITAVASNSIYKGPHDEVALLSLRFKNGATAEICSSSIFSSPTRFEVYGTEGYFIAEDTLGRHGRGKIWSDKSELVFAAKNPFVEQLENFSRAIIDNSPVAVDGVEGLRNTNLLIQAAGMSSFL